MFKGASRNTNRTKGVGLGLTTARSLSHALQGAISLQTKEGIGTKVTFSTITLFEQESIDAQSLTDRLATMHKTHSIYASRDYLSKLGIICEKSSQLLVQYP